MRTKWQYKEGCLYFDSIRNSFFFPSPKHDYYFSHLAFFVGNKCLKDLIHFPEFLRNKFE